MKDTLESIQSWWLHAPLFSQLASVIYHAGNIARTSDRQPTVKAGEGHRSIETAGDNIAQEYILEQLSHYPDLKFLCEEDSENPRVLNKKKPLGILAGKTVVVDPIDGTASYASKDSHWVTAAGLLLDGKFVGSALYAPEMNGGVFCASYGDGVTLFSENGSQLRKVDPASSVLSAKQSIIYRGVDTELYWNAVQLSHKIAPNFRAVYTRGSGLLGLMYVALGRAQAIIQTPQKAWDWAPAYHAVVRAGKVFRFFRIVNTELVPVERFDYQSFIFDKNNRDNRLGFIAGEPDVANKLFDLLPTTGWERISPDTSGVWN